MNKQAPTKSPYDSDLNSIANRFVRIFAGRKDARGTIDGGCTREKLKMAHVFDHLEGKVSLGRYPVLDNGTCEWAVIDFDYKSDTNRIELAEKKSREFAKKLFEIGLKSCWFERSRSGMIHLWLFFSEYVKARKIRRVLQYVADKLRLKISNGVVEIFPKQDELSNEQIGNYVHLPYFGVINNNKLDRRVMLDPNTLNTLSLDDFLDRVEHSLISPNELEQVYASLPDETPQRDEMRYKNGWNKLKTRIIKLLEPNWNEGQRQDICLYTAGFLAKQGVSWERTEELILEIAENKDDNEIRQRLAAIQSTYEKVKRGEVVRGYEGLEELLSKEDLEMLTNLFHEGGKIRGLTVEEIKSREIDPKRFINRKLAIMRGSVTTISGPPGVGKTWFTLDLTRCVILGEQLLGQFPTIKGKVAYFDQENPFSVLQERIILLNLPNAGVRFFHFENFNIERDLEEIKKIAEEFDLLIFDSLIQFHDRNEDKASEIKIVMSKFKEVTRDCGCAIILLHQNRKPGQFEKNDMYTARGSLQIIYDSDMAFILKKSKQDGRILEVTKSRIVKEPKPFKFEIEEIDGKEVRLKYLGDYEEIESKKERAIILVPIVLKDSSTSLSWEEIQIKLKERGLDVSEPTLRSILRELEEGMIIKSNTGTRGKKYYSLIMDDEAEKEVDEEIEEFLKETEAV